MSETPVIQGQYGPASPETFEPDPTPSGIAFCDTPENLVLNCSFETGDFTDWDAQDMASPFFPQTVAGPTYIGYGFFTSAPTDGTVSALNGFDGAGPDTIELGQDVTLISDSIITLQFDYRAAWDMDTFSDGALDRDFIVSVEPPGGGTPMQTTTILTAMGDTIELDTGVITETVDLSAFAGQSVRVNFEWNVPENATGPAFFELDNVSITGGTIGGAATSVPALGGGGMLIMGAVLLAAAALFMRRRKSRA